MFDLHKLLDYMVKNKASDLYITVDAPPMFKIDGNLRKTDNELLQPQDTDVIARALMSPKQEAEFDEINEMNLPLYIKDCGRFRVNVFRQRGYVGLVIRHIKADIASFEDLHLPPELGNTVLGKRGLILLVGATGSGKTTTLATMVDHRNRNLSGHIVTIEDPIEFVHEHKKSLITQREIGIDTDSFHNALKNSLRQAPDVILIGEVRDYITMEAAITYAETGHLVLATLHSNNAHQAIERIMNFFPEERHAQIYMQLSLNLKAIFSQRLLKGITGSRIPAVEMMLDSPRIKDLLLKGRITELKEAIESGSSHNMQSFDQAVYELYKAGKVTLDEALLNSDSQHNVRLRVKLDEEKSIIEKKSRLVNVAMEDKRVLTTGLKLDE